MWDGGLWPIPPDPHNRDMNTATGTAALWMVALIAAYMVLAPILAFLDSTFSTFSQIGL